MELIALCIGCFIWGYIVWNVGAIIEDGLNLKGIGFFIQIIGIIFIASSSAILLFTISAAFITAFIAAFVTFIT